ncbi:hypothetical protein EJ06DRAFT_432832 [Trichodelitschia bisporula]|uniref:Uncharacterized protein n=1 Tax=Trichodelitschia bisporula TaxID=703511 RepID=A0A6G1HX39_9PEZI|nr:hypothetical protein EJ06DRAFT_432832 [Trichodelitschia bisporula]
MRYVGRVVHVKGGQSSMSCLERFSVDCRDSQPRIRQRHHLQKLPSIRHTSAAQIRNTRLSCRHCITRFINP